MNKSNFFNQGTVIPSFLKKKKNNSICVICVSSYKTKTHLNSCKHVFCYECIDKWLQVVSSCPCCKQFVSQIKFFDVTTNQYIYKEIEIKTNIDVEDHIGMGDIDVDVDDYDYDDDYDDDDDDDDENNDHLEVIVDTRHGYDSDEGFVVDDDDIVQYDDCIDGLPDDEEEFSSNRWKHKNKHQHKHKRKRRRITNDDDDDEEEEEEKEEKEEDDDDNDEEEGAKKLKNSELDDEEIHDETKLGRCRPVESVIERTGTKRPVSERHQGQRGALMEDNQVEGQRDRGRGSVKMGDDQDGDEENQDILKKPIDFRSFMFQG